MRFFIDNNLSPQLAAGMKAFGEDVVHLTEVFPAATEDVVWLKHVGESENLLVTRVERIRWHPAEIAAFKENNVGAFFLGGKHRSRCQLIQQLVRNWPKMKELGANQKRPFAFKVPPTGAKFTPLNLD